MATQREQEHPFFFPYFYHTKKTLGQIDHKRQMGSVNSVKGINSLRVYNNYK